MYGTSIFFSSINFFLVCVNCCFIVINNSFIYNIQICLYCCDTTQPCNETLETLKNQWDVRCRSSSSDTWCLEQLTGTNCFGHRIHFYLNFQQVLNSFISDIRSNKWELHLWNGTWLRKFHNSPLDVSHGQQISFSLREVSQPFETLKKKKKSTT